MHHDESDFLMALAAILRAGKRRFVLITHLEAVDYADHLERIAEGDPPSSESDINPLFVGTPEPEPETPVAAHPVVHKSSHKKPPKTPKAVKTAKKKTTRRK